MPYTHRGRFLVLVGVICLTATAFCKSPKNVILFIGDGMGFEHVKAAGYYANGRAGRLFFEGFKHKAEMTTHPVSGAITDSAASGTAMATGCKVRNGVVSMAIPGDGGELETLVEYFKKKGKSTGLVTTTYITHATPACFGAHAKSRQELADIAGDYLSQTRPNVLFGAGGHEMSPDQARQAGYTVVTDALSLSKLDTENVSMVSGQFGNDIPYEYDRMGKGGQMQAGVLPSLSQMTAVALKVLDNDADGFFLMVEGGKIDWAAHANHLERVILETVELDCAVRQACKWAAGWDDTLIIVTADHETGGLRVTSNEGKGNWPIAAWSSKGHTAAKVPVYATGPGAEMVSGVLDNTDIFRIAKAQGSAAGRIAETREVVLLLAGLAVLFVLVKLTAVKSRD